jgi:prefoldin subunit 5
MAELTAEQKRHFLASQLENYQTQRYRNVVELSIVKNAAEAIGEDYKTKKELDEVTKQMDWKNEELDVAIATIEAMVAELPEVVE